MTPDFRLVPGTLLRSEQMLWLCDRDSHNYRDGRMNIKWKAFQTAMIIEVTQFNVLLLIQRTGLLGYRSMSSVIDTSRVTDTWVPQCPR